MGNKVKRNKEKVKTESFLTTCCHFFQYVLDYIVCLYMLLIIVVMPLYHQEGYTHIGTDKHTFFRNCSLTAAKIFLPTLAVFCVCAIIRYLAEERPRRRQQKISGNPPIHIFDRLKKSLSVTDVFALLYGMCLILSYLFSEYKSMALWGATGWYMGLIPQLIFLGVYFAISRLWKKRNWVFLLFLPISAFVFLLGFLNRFGIYPIDMKIENPEFISTIGNINWYCGYLVSVFFVGFYLLWQGSESIIAKSKTVNSKFSLPHEKLWLCGKILLVLYTAIGFATLVTQGSASGIVTLMALFIITFRLSVGNESKMRTFWQEVLLFATVCLVICFVRIHLTDSMTYTDGIFDLFTESVFPAGIFLLACVFLGLLAYAGRQERYPEKMFRILADFIITAVAGGILVLAVMIVLNTIHPGILGAWSDIELFTFSYTWGSNRGATWQVGIMCFGDQNWLHKIVGVGPDCMEMGISQSGNVQIKSIIYEIFGMLRLTNAHNEWLTVLINTGILGCISYVGMIVSAIIRYVRTHRSESVIVGACGFGVLAFTINNMFSFQQTMGMATIFVILGVGEAYVRKGMVII